MVEEQIDVGALRAELRQHARTLGLMGVDFLPVAGAASPVRAVPSHDPEASERVESAGPTPAGAPDAAPIREIKPHVQPPSPAGVDPERAEAQSLLDALRERYEQDAPHSKFVTDHHSIVFGEGDPRARLMFVGEAPGAEEDKVGRPFVGRAGQLLDKMIVAMGLRREQVYICNVLKTRPPNNATPTLEEAALCAPYLFEQIAIIRPEAIVTLGLPATRVLLNTIDSMSRLRGRWATFDPGAGLLGFAGQPARPVPVMPTYHPAFLLRAYTTDNRQKVWSDLQQVVARLGLMPPKAAVGPQSTG